MRVAELWLPPPPMALSVEDGEPGRVVVDDGDGDAVAVDDDEDADDVALLDEDEDVDGLRSAEPPEPGSPKPVIIQVSK